jgi:hypothetical protein
MRDTRVRIRLTPMAYQIYQKQADTEALSITDVIRREWALQPAQQLDLVVEAFLKPLEIPRPKNLASLARREQEEADSR